jgi:excisionase family DNA binding protein
MPRNIDGYYTHREVADILGYTADYVHDLTKQGRIPHVKFHKGIAGRYELRYPKEDIDKMRVEAERNTNKTGHFFSGRTEATGPKQPEEQEWFSCDKCGEAVHRNDVVAHINLHTYNEKD